MTATSDDTLVAFRVDHRAVKMLTLFIIHRYTHTDDHPLQSCFVCNVHCGSKLLGKKLAKLIKLTCFEQDKLGVVQVRPVETPLDMSLLQWGNYV